MELLVASDYCQKGFLVSFSIDWVDVAIMELFIDMEILVLFV